MYLKQKSTGHDQFWASGTSDVLKHFIHDMKDLRYLEKTMQVLVRVHALTRESHELTTTRPQDSMRSIGRLILHEVENLIPIVAVR